MSRIVGLALAITLSAGCATSGFGTTMASVKRRGSVSCGITDAVPGFGVKAGTTYQGFDVDFCRAIAAAVLGDDRKVTLVPLGVADRFHALERGRVDVLFRNTTWTLSRDVGGRFRFAPPFFYDGQGFLLRGDAKATELAHLAGKRICVVSGTTSEVNLRDVLTRLKVHHTAVPGPSIDALAQRYFGGGCDVVTGDRSALIAMLSRAPKPEEHVVIGPTISKEPLGPVVRAGDDQWYDVVRYVVYATFEAEELGLTSANAADARAQPGGGPHKRLLGAEGDLGPALGLPRDWAFEVVKQVGNYGEIYDRHFGPATPTPIPRWMNKPWLEGGLLYAPPFR